MKRLFIAIKIGKSETLQEVVKGFQKLERGINWVDINKLHLTLAFLGSTDEALIPSLRDMLFSVCSKYPVLNLELNGIGTFGSKRNPHVLWVGMKENKDLLSLQSDLHNRLTEMGILLEERSFKPHITLGRIKRIERFQEFSSLVEQDSKSVFGTTKVINVILFESKLTPSGPIYTELISVKLQ